MSVKIAVQTISSETGGSIDVLVNNAGYVLGGAYQYDDTINKKEKGVCG